MAMYRDQPRYRSYKRDETETCRLQDTPVRNRPTPVRKPCRSVLPGLFPSGESTFDIEMSRTRSMNRAFRHRGRHAGTAANRYLRQAKKVTLPERLFE